MTNNIQSPSYTGVINPSICYSLVKKHRIGIEPICRVPTTPMLKGKDGNQFQTNELNGNTPHLIPHPLLNESVNDSCTNGEGIILTTVEFHSVGGKSRGSGVGNDFPVTVCFNLRLDVADGCSHVTDTETTSCLTWGESSTGSEVVHDSTLLGWGGGVDARGGVWHKICSFKVATAH